MIHCTITLQGDFQQRVHVRAVQGQMRWVLQHGERAALRIPSPVRRAPDADHPRLIKGRISGDGR